jgi:hypothetical protein
MPLSLQNLKILTTKKGKEKKKIHQPQRVLSFNFCVKQKKETKKSKDETLPLQPKERKQTFFFMNEFYINRDIIRVKYWMNMQTMHLH